MGRGTQRPALLDAERQTVKVFDLQKSSQKLRFSYAENVILNTDALNSITAYSKVFLSMLFNVEGNLTVFKSSQPTTTKEDDEEVFNCEAVALIRDAIIADLANAKDTTPYAIKAEVLNFQYFHHFT